MKVESCVIGLLKDHFNIYVHPCTPGTNEELIFLAINHALYQLGAPCVVARDSKKLVKDDIVQFSSGCHTKKRLGWTGASQAFFWHDNNKDLNAECCFSDAAQTTTSLTFQIAYNKDFVMAVTS